ncbi:MAG: protease PrsW, partial [Spirochaetia bacterium]|nr:protease PrsW [Spirochaetia bacterium]
FAIYFYYRDKYEKEPVSLLLKTLLLGVLISIPVILLEKYLENFISIAGDDSYLKAGFSAFIVASFSEELFKLLAVYWLIWKNSNFNELFDGIVYCVYVSLGFAAIENVIYVYNGGASVALLRAFTAVPAHTLFGVAMGYNFGLAKFNKDRRVFYLVFSFIIPFILHGIYDFILMSNDGLLLLGFIPYMIYLWSRSKKRINELSDASIFMD